MKNIVIVASILLMGTSIFLVRNLSTSNIKKTESSTFLQPEGEEDPNRQIKRKAWIELIHKTASGIDWREIESRNQDQINDYKTKTFGGINTRGGIEFFADSAVFGQWYERGPFDVCGSQRATDYDPETDYLYSIGDGGPIFKGKSDGSNWKVLNQEFRFGSNFIRIFKTPNGKRISTSRNSKPYYSDDDGKTWTEAVTEVPNASVFQRKDWTVLNDPGKTAFFLSNEKSPSSGTQVRLYRSTNYGESYETVDTLQSNNPQDYLLLNPGFSNDLYLLQRTTTKTRFFKWNFTSSEFELLNEGSLGLGSNFDFKASCAYTPNGNLRMYVLNKNNIVFQSDDLGASWQQKAELPISPWDVGIFCFPSAPNFLMFGEVNCYRSQNSGGSWIKINEWWEYYGNVKFKLHADMMYFKEFQKTDGSYFTVNCNHGGISVTKNYGETNVNITLKNLNNAQFYDVRTKPGSFNLFTAGSQDQGWQSGSSDPEDRSVLSLKQVISGDYGHLEFTKNGTGFWTVYPGGAITFYTNNFSKTLGYEIDSQDESVWIPPLVSTGETDKHAVYLAGGSTILGGSGSFLIRLEYINSELVVTQFPYDFKADSGGEVSAVSVSPLDNKRIYVTTSNGKFYVSENKGLQWFKTASVPGGQYLYGSGILSSELDLDVVYVCGSGYSNPAVLKSTTGGLTFQPMSTGLPGTLVFNIVANEDESLFFAATEAGPFIYSVAKGSWYPLAGKSTPNQTFWSVEYIPNHKIARFGTYGRGAWDFRVDDATVSSIVNQAVLGFKVYPNPAVNSLNVVTGDLNFESFRIHTLNGNLIQEVNSIGNNNEIDIATLPKGIYIIQAKNGSKNYTQKFIKM